MNIEDPINLLLEKISSWIEQFILILPNLMIAFIVMIVFGMVSKFVQKLVKRFFSQVVQVKNEALVNFMGTLVKMAVLLLGFLISIKILKLDEAIFSVLAGVGIAGIALGFAFQDIAANFIAGIALVFRPDRPFNVGDIVEANGYVGHIKEINLRDSLLETFQGHSVFIPNKALFENAVINYSFIGKRRIDLAVGVSYGDNLEKVKQVTHDAVDGIVSRLPSEKVSVYFAEFGDSSINLLVHFWVSAKSMKDFLLARSDAVMAIKKAYDENDITIPFPIRTLDFGIKGGQKLDEMIPDDKA